MFTKKDLIDYLASRVAYYVYDDPTIQPKSKEVKEMALESWADQDFLEYVMQSEKIKGCDILQDYYKRVWEYCKSATTQEGKEVFIGAMSNAAQIEEDLLMQYGEEYYDNSMYSL